MDHVYYLHFCHKKLGFLHDENFKVLNVFHLGMIGIHFLAFFHIFTNLKQILKHFPSSLPFLCLNLVHKFKIMVKINTHIVQVWSFCFQKCFHLDFKMSIWMYSIQINVVLKGKHLISCPCTIFYFSIGHD
jgi:hypothetical protein